MRQGAWLKDAGVAGGAEADREVPRFLPVRVGGGGGASAHSKRPAEVEVTLRNGWRVRVAGDLPPEGLVELLVLLEGEARC